MNKNILIIGIIVLLGLGGLFVFNQQMQQAKVANEKAVMMKKDEDAKMAKVKEDAVMKNLDKAMIKEKENIMMMASKDTTSKKAILADVSGGNGTGKAFVLRKNGKLYFTASATLPEPVAGTFYEGWLAVKGANPAQFTSTGKLEKQKDGSYETSYSSSNLYEGYDFVVITWEKVDDQKPEKHILEGLAK